MFLLRIKKGGVGDENNVGEEKALDGQGGFLAA